MTRFPRFITFLVLIFASISALAQTATLRSTEYINQYRQLAIDEMFRTGIPASITLAQGILETGGGQSDLASIANNHFGIKCKNEWTGETMLHDDDAKNECFRKYPNVEASYRDHSDFLRSRPNYAFLFKLDPTDYEGWAKGLKKAGYATSPTYAQRLMKIIVDNNLQDITLLALQQQRVKENALFALQTNNTPAETQETVTTEPEILPIARQVSTAPTDYPNQKENVSRQGVVPYPVNTVFTINQCKVIYSKAGTSLLALANNYNISYSKLLEYNDLAEIDIITNDQLVFLQKKQKRGSKDIHVVEANETVHDICQKEGIQMESLLEFNRLQKGMQPASGENLYLKFPAPNSPRLASNAKSYSETSMR